MPADSIPRGLTQECLYNDHAQCQGGGRGCRCDCHKRLPSGPKPAETKVVDVHGNIVRVELANEQSVGMESAGAALESEGGGASASVGQAVGQAAGRTASLTKFCPSCKQSKSAYERFCRADGTKLSSSLCPVCTVAGEPSDLFCHGCGANLDAARSKSIVAKVATHVPTEPSELDRDRIDEAGIEPSQVESPADIAKAQQILAAMAADPDVAQAAVTNIMAGKPALSTYTAIEVESKPLHPNTVKVEFSPRGVKPAQPSEPAAVGAVVKPRQRSVPATAIRLID